MEPDNQNSDRYFVVDNEGSVFNGWIEGWNHFRNVGSPTVSLDVKPQERKSSLLLDVGDLELAHFWPETIDYDQNTPGILAVAEDRNRRRYNSWIDKAFWLNVARVPICVQYLSACAKVRPSSILELGTGGSSSHSTGMFLTWLEGQPEGRSLVSVDRHPLNDSWGRYRRYSYWRFIQGDSLKVLHALIDGKIKSDKWFDMIFIDSSHLYPHTLAELRQCSLMTDAILMDDTTDEGVVKSLDEWLPQNTDWIRVNLGATVTLLERKPKV